MHRFFFLQKQKSIDFLKKILVYRGCKIIAGTTLRSFYGSCRDQNIKANATNYNC